jgi:hypothetical protein
LYELKELAQSGRRERKRRRKKKVTGETSRGVVSCSLLPFLIGNRMGGGEIGRAHV